MLFFKQKPKVKLVGENEKFEKIKKVQPNIIFNRHDIRYGDDFYLLEVENHYIPFHIENDCAVLGLYMTEIDKNIFDSVIKYINKNFSIIKFYVVQSLNGKEECEKTIHSLLELDENMESFNKRFSAKTNYNRRYLKQKLEKTYECEYKYFNRESLTPELLEDFFNLKLEAKKNIFYQKGSDLLDNFFYITDVYTLWINKKLASIILYSIIDEKHLYCTNMAFDKEYSKYGIGSMIFYHSIEDLINRGYRKIYLGGGHYDYKKNAKSIVSNTYQGDFYCIKKLFSKYTIKNNSEILKCISILGKNFVIKRYKTDYNMYLDWYKKANLKKQFKILAKKYKDKKIVIYGAGLMAQVLFENYDLKDLNIVGVCDRKFEPGDEYYSYKGFNPNQIDTIKPDLIIVAVFRYEDVFNSLKTMTNSENIQPLVKTADL